MRASHRIVRTAILLITAFVPATCGIATSQEAAAASPSSGPYKIAGVVVNSRTGSAVAQALVGLTDSNTRKNVASAKTGADGRFSFSGLPAGKYALEATKPGYLNSGYDQHESYFTAIVTGPDFATEDLVFRLTPVAMISGHIVDVSGDPVREAAVTLYAQLPWGGVNRVVRLATSIADDRGFYEFAQLPPATFFISVTAKPWYAVEAPSASRGPEPDLATSARQLALTYPTTYYGGATETDRAVPLRLKGGDHAQADVTLNPLPAIRVLIRTNAANNEGDGNQPPDSLVLSRQVFDYFQHLGKSHLEIIQPGLYELSGVAPGRYTTWLSDPTSGKWQKTIELDLRVEGQEVDVSRAEPLSSFKVTLKMEGKNQLPSRLLLGLLDQKRVLTRVAEVNAAGEATFVGLIPGKYALICDDPEGTHSSTPYAVTKISSGTEESIGHDIVVGAGDTEERTAWLSFGPTRIQGIVHKAGKPVAGAMVLLIPKNPESHFELFRRDQTDFDGTFNFYGVIPGPYTVVALDSAWESEWGHPDALARYVKQGQHISIEGEMAGSLNLPEPVEAQQP